MGEGDGVLLAVTRTLDNHTALEGLPLPARLHGIDPIRFDHRDRDDLAPGVVHECTLPTLSGLVLLDLKGQRPFVHKGIRKRCPSLLGTALLVHGIDIAADQRPYVSDEGIHLTFSAFSDPGSVIVCAHADRIASKLVKYSGKRRCEECQDFIAAGNC